MPNVPAGADDPTWLRAARSYLGLKEIAGKVHEAKIIGWWSKIKTSFRDDETPWCAAFVGGVLEEVGIKSTRSAAARSYMKFGVRLNQPAYGCVVVFWRGKPSGFSGHVGFVVGKDKAGNLMVLGGNQGNAVTIRAFSKDRVLGYRWPGIYPREERFTLPLLDSDGTLSTNEA